MLYQLNIRITPRQHNVLHLFDAVIDNIIHYNTEQRPARIPSLVLHALQKLGLQHYLYNVPDAFCTHFTSTDLLSGLGSEVEINVRIHILSCDLILLSLFVLETWRFLVYKSRGFFVVY